MYLQNVTIPAKKSAPEVAPPANIKPVQEKVRKPENTANSPQEKLSGEYVDYSEITLSQKLSEGKKVVLFFHAGWCPTCKSADKNIRNAQSTIPQDVVLLKVNYDKEGGLKNKYDVTYQHTFVQIAKDGSAVTKFRGARTVSALLANLQ